MVIAIIAILAAILLPALQSAKEKAQNIKCTSNLKNMHTYLTLYIDGNNDTAPAYSGNFIHRDKVNSADKGDQGKWASLLYMEAFNISWGPGENLYDLRNGTDNVKVNKWGEGDYNGAFDQIYAPYSKGPNEQPGCLNDREPQGIFACPAAMYKVYLTDDYAFSYGMNAFGYSELPMSLIHNPTKTAAIMDINQGNGAGIDRKNGGAAATCLSDVYYVKFDRTVANGVAQGNKIAPKDIAASQRTDMVVGQDPTQAALQWKHRGSANVLFADGHASNVTRTEIPANGAGGKEENSEYFVIPETNQFWKSSEVSVK